MIDYIKSLLPRLQQYSKSLNDTAIFAEVPWIFIDDEGVPVTYIFRRNAELLVSKRGEVTTGRWEYLSVMQSLLIEHANRKQMYNQGFIDNAVMALRKDGTNDLFLMANQMVLPDLNISGYLAKKVQAKEIKAKEVDSKESEAPMVSIKLINPARQIKIETKKGYAFTFNIGCALVDGTTGNPLEDGIYNTESGFRLQVENGKLKDVSSSSGIISVMIGLVLIILFILAIAFYYKPT